MTTTSPRQHLETEISAQRNSFYNRMATRASHPTYGVTKGSLLESLHHLEGLIAAHRILFDPAICPNVPWVTLSAYAAWTFDIDLTVMHTDYKNA